MYVIFIMPNIVLHIFQIAPTEVNELIHVKELSANYKYFAHVTTIIIVK
jgi:hypothetical protein